LVTKTIFKYYRRYLEKLFISEKREVKIGGKGRDSSLKKRLFLDSAFLILLLLNIFGLYSNLFLAYGARIIRVPGDYNTIQKAINAASPGDTIQVAKGTYHEYVVVNKSVTLIGENQQSIIDGPVSPPPPRIIDVTVSNVKISGFTIQNKGTYRGFGIEPPFGQTITKVNISDNAVINTYHGVYLAYCTNCYITNNTLNGNYYSIRLYDSDYNVIQNNKINGSMYYGINLYTHADSNKIISNTLTKNKYAVLLEWSDRNTMEYNSISSSTEYGIRLSYSTGTLTKRNNVMNNKYGVYIWNCSGNQFYQNNFIDNTYQVQHYDAPLTANTWDTNVRPGTQGNFWSDYTGFDDGSGVGRWGETRVRGDGVGDTKIPHLGVDWYPLMHPWTLGPAPVAIFTFSPLEPLVNQLVTFNASKSYDSNGTIVSYKWNFGDGTPIVTEPDPITTHTFTLAGTFNATLTVTDNDGLTNSTSKFVKVLAYRLTIDLYTQKPEPYSGKGANQPSDAFEPEEEVILYAEVTYNYEPVESKMVGFTAIDPNQVTIVDRSNTTDANGIAYVSFRLQANETFGTWTAFATVTVSEKTANDTLTFQVGWIIEIIKVETVDQNGGPKNSYIRGELVYFDMDVKNIAFTPKSTVLTVTLLDESSQIIGVADLSIEVPPGTHEFNLAFNVRIPRWSLVGSANAPSCAFTNWPWLGGVPYCPEKIASFLIVVG